MHRRVALAGEGTLASLRDRTDKALGCFGGLNN